MKNLRNFCVAVRTEYERHVAIQFFRRSCHVPVIHINPSGVYVGITNEYPGRSAALPVKPRSICCGNVACPNETIIPFENISELADTPNRVAALKHARKKFCTA